MENLLVFKLGTSYLRDSDGNVSECGIEKASVWPERRVAQMLARYAELKAIYPGLGISRLIVREEPYYGDRQ